MTKITLTCSICKQDIAVSLIDNQAVLQNFVCDKGHTFNVVNNHCYNCGKNWINYAVDRKLENPWLCKVCHKLNSFSSLIPKKYLTSRTNGSILRKEQRVKNNRSIVISLLKSIFGKDKLVWSKTEKCPKCELDSVWYEFSEKGVKKICSFCGEL